MKEEPETRDRAMRCCGYPPICAAAAILALLPLEAWAGAWTLPAGEGQAIATVAAASASSRFTTDRDSEETARFDKAEGNVLVEYGLTDAVTARARLEAEMLSFSDQPENDKAGLGFADVGARVRVLQRGSLVGSLEGTVRLGSASDVPGYEPDGRRYVSEYEARALAGYGFTAAGYAVFVNGEVAYRVRDGLGPDEVRVDLTAGARPREDTLVLVQSFSTIGLERPETAVLGHEGHKLQLSGVYDLGDAVSVQAGAFSSVAGRDTLEERGGFAAVWYRF